MSSDDAYQAFLDKANGDTSSSKNTAAAKSSGGSYKTAADVPTNNHTVPAALKKVDAFYVSETDDAFEPVSVKHDGEEVPDEKTLGKLLNLSVEEISKKDFDPRDQYAEVTDAVEKVSKGEVKYFQVQLDKTRVLYLVLGADGKGSVCGLKALAVYS